MRVLIQVDSSTKVLVNFEKEGATEQDVLEAIRNYCRENNYTMPATFTIEEKDAPGPLLPFPTDIIKTMLPPLINMFEYSDVETFEQALSLLGVPKKDIPACTAKQWAYIEELLNTNADLSGEHETIIKVTNEWSDFFKTQEVGFQDGYRSYWATLLIFRSLRKENPDDAECFSLLIKKNEARGDPAAIKYIINLQLLDMNARNSKDQNFLMIAILKERPDISTFLIEKGINVLHEDKESSTAIYYAARYDDLVTAKALLATGKIDVTTIQPIAKLHKNTVCEWLGGDEATKLVEKSREQHTAAKKNPPRLSSYPAHDLWKSKEKTIESPTETAKMLQKNRS